MRSPQYGNRYTFQAKPTMSAYSLFPPLVILLLSFPLLAFSTRCHPNDYKALLEIKKALNNPYDWISWKPDDPECCEWLAVSCDDKTNRIMELGISQSDLKFPIPDAVGDLEYLKSLGFHKTNLTGQIPRAITKLSRLSFLDLRWNHLTGLVPSFLGQLKKLEYIGLSFNNFTGSIPASLSTLPELGGLLLDRNKLTGSIPYSFGEFRQQDFYLYLSHNQLSGQIPRTLGYTNFSWFDVSRNRLEGDISFMFGKNKSIGTADFSRNILQFELSRVEYFQKSLRNLDLNHNRITGGLPKGLAGIDLISLNVSYNRLCGQIPTGGRLQDIGYDSYFHNRCLCGAPLPKCK